MANNVGNTLSRLIKERGYLAGTRMAARRRMSRAASKVQAAQRAHLERQAEVDAVVLQLSALDQKIKALGIEHPDAIKAVRRTPRRLGRPRGMLRREFVRFLTSAKVPVSTAEIRSHMVEACELPVATADDRYLVHRCVKSILKYMLTKGLIKRLHDPRTAKLGYWTWVGR